MDGRPMPLRCDEVCERLSEYLDGELTADDGVRVAAHLVRCDACDRFARELAAIVGALHALRCCPNR